MPNVVLAGIFLLLGIAGFLGAQIGMPRRIEDRSGSRKNYPRTWVKIGACVAVILAPVIFWLSGFTSVPVKSVGVVTTYGKVGAEYGPGSHWLLPWKSLAIIQDTIQSDKFAMANGDAPDQQQPSGVKGYCIKVRLAGLNQGCADVQLQTQVVPGAIPELYANYSSYGPNLTLDVDQFVVQRELQTWLNRDLGDYNVIQDVAASLTACSAQQGASTGCTSNVSSQFGQFDPVVLKSMQTDPELAGKINVLDINIQYMNFDPSTETAIRKIQDSYLATVEATQQERTNAAISLANAALAKQNSLSPAVLQNECYTTTQLAMKDNYALPPSWNCSGTNSSLLVSGSGK